MLLWKHKRLSLLFILFAVVYALQALLVAPDKNTIAKYRLSVGHLHELELTIVLPYIIIEFVALICYLRLYDYSHHISQDSDGRAWKLVSRGLLWLVLWLPLVSLINGFSAQYYHLHPSSTADLVRASNYLTLLLLIPAFYYVNKGSRRLLALLKGTTPHVYQRTMLGYIAFSVIYTWLALSDSARNHATAQVHTSSYYEADWLLVLTVIIPRLFMWYLGVQAVQNFILYRQRIKGSLYKRAVRNLAAGLGIVIISYILLRVVQSLSVPLSHLNLRILLLVVYGLLIIIAVGYLLISRGAKELQKIEGL